MCPVIYHLFICSMDLYCCCWVFFPPNPELSLQKTHIYTHVDIISRLLDVTEFGFNKSYSSGQSNRLIRTCNHIAALLMKGCDLHPCNKNSWLPNPTFRTTALCPCVCYLIVMYNIDKHYKRVTFLVHSSAFDQ